MHQYIRARLTGSSEKLGVELFRGRKVDGGRQLPVPGQLCSASIDAGIQHRYAGWHGPCDRSTKGDWQDSSHLDRSSQLAEVDTIPDFLIEVPRDQNSLRIVISLNHDSVPTAPSLVNQLGGLAPNFCDGRDGVDAFRLIHVGMLGLGLEHETVGDARIHTYTWPDSTGD